MIRNKAARKTAKNTRQAMASRSRKAPRESVVTRPIKWAVFSLAIFSIVGIAGWYLWSQQPVTESQPAVEQLMPIRLVEIQGELKHVEQEQVLTVLRSMSRATDDDQQTLNFLTADLRELEKELERVAWIYRVKVRRIWPDKLIIDLEEQQAIAVWNEIYLVNSFGQLFQPEVIAEDALPRLSGPSEKLDELLVTFTELQTAFEQADLQMNELHLSDRLSFQLKLTNGIAVEVGRKNLQARVNRLIDLYPTLVSDNPAPIERIDLRYDTGLAVKRMTRQASL